MPVLELVRPIADLPTETNPLLKLSSRRTGVGGPVQDSLVVAIENPKVAGRQGYLFAEHFRVSPVSLSLTNVLYLRVGAASFFPLEQREYERVERIQGFRPGMDTQSTHEFFQDTWGEILPLPSETPYQLAFFTPEEFQGFISGIKEGEEKLKETVELVNEQLARKVAVFGIEPNSGALVLPDNYASLGIDQITRPQLPYFNG